MPKSETALCDTGPLVALFSAGQYRREDCRVVLFNIRGSLTTTLAVLTEAFYFLDQQSERELLWEWTLRAALQVAEILPSDVVRMRHLMEKYADLPMDFADASLVAVSERLKIGKVFTLDRHFRVYRPRHTSSFEIVP